MENKKWNQAVSRIAVGEFRMKRFQCPDRGKPDEEKTDMEKEAEKTVVANVQLHYAVANNNSKLKLKDDALKQF